MFEMARLINIMLHFAFLGVTCTSDPLLANAKSMDLYQTVAMQKTVDEWCPYDHSIGCSYRCCHRYYTGNWGPYQYYKYDRQYGHNRRYKKVQAYVSEKKRKIM